MTLRRTTLHLCFSIPVFVAATTLVSLTPSAHAQNATTSLRGTVKDPEGAVVPGAEVDLNDKASGQKLTTKANGNGEYSFTQIPPSTYTITVSSSGFGNQSKVAQLLVNQPSTVDFTLSVQSTSVAVDVSVEAETINTTDASLGDAKNNELVQSLPSETRNPADLLSLEPGVFALPTTVQAAPEQDSRSGAVNGERSDQGNITLDGVDDNDQLRGLAFFPVLRETQDSLDEFRTVTGNGGADAGRSSGAQVSLVTKSGNNKYHGAAYEYFRASNTVANDWFNKQAQLESGEDNRPPKLIRNIFGGDLGGRIIRDKLFFFGNFEGQRQAESTVVTQTTPLASYQQGLLTYPNPTGGGTTVLTPAQIAVLDASCAVCLSSAYPPPPGPNPNALTYFNQLPTANTNNPGANGDGYNEANYVFASPNPVRLNTSIVRLDYLPTSKHRLFFRGNLQKDYIGGTENFPGQGPQTTTEDNSKGFAIGDTWTISSSLVNDLRYGFIREGYGQTGIGSGDYVDFRFLSSPTAETRTTIISVPVNNIVDNLSFVKGKHDVEVGANWRLVHINRTSNNTTFNSASTNPFWLYGLAPDPSVPVANGGLGEPSVNDGGFSTSYKIAYANLVGTVPSVTNEYNYHVDSATSGTLLSDGAPLIRHFKANEYETYIQDQWRILPNLTITYGLRWTILQTPWETKGQEVAPTINTHEWFTARETAALQGAISEPDLQFAPAGPYYGKPGFWPKSKNNVAPRFSIVYSPNQKTSIRAGAGIYYDHYGEGLINTFDQNGSFGISSSVTSPPDVQDTESSPRYTARNVLPFSNGTVPQTQVYPYTAPTDNFAITWGLDDRLKTPYTEAFDLSLQRDIPGGFSIEANYVGRLGRHLLQQLDLGQPVDYTDPAGGGDYYSAGAQLSKAVDANGGSYTQCGQATGATVGAIPYFEHVFPYLQNFEYPGESATNAIYNCEWAPNRYQNGATTGLADLDFYCYNGTLQVPYNCPAQSRFWQDQFSSLYALSTIGMSYYNALQIALRHPSRHGFQADINYTFSKSIDMGSDAERTSELSSPNGTGIAAAGSEIINTWKPYLNRAVSDFDTKHIVTIDSLYQLPFGKGKAFANTNNFIVNSLIGGWQLSGVFRATSGLPWDVREPGWTTDWQIEGYGIQTAPVHIKKHIDPMSGDPAYFTGSTTGTDINNTVTSGAPIRLPYPGETGQRNNFRGDGYLDLDTGVSKKWELGDYGTLKFTWEVYNATNTARFDPESIGEGLTLGGLGIATSELTAPRRMQFSLRYDF
jgi:hypothetical protein